MKWYVYKVGKMYISKVGVLCEDVKLSSDIENAFISRYSLSETTRNHSELKTAVKATGAKEYVMEEVENDV